MADRLHQVVIVGGGFGGLYAARSLKRAPVEVTLIDRHNYHLFQPLLYQVATGGLSPANIAAPLRGLLKHQKNTRVLLGEVTTMDVAGRRIFMDKIALDYDSLIVATGGKAHYFGHPEWAHLAPNPKTLDDATQIRRRILLAFEGAERKPDPKLLPSWLTFVVVGGGPTGVELAGALAELAHTTLKKDFRAINPADAQIILVEGEDRILPPYPPSLSFKATKSLERLGVRVQTGTIVTDVQPDRVTLRKGKEIQEIPARTILWAAGVEGSSLGKVLADASQAKLVHGGRIAVQPDLEPPRTSRGFCDRGSGFFGRPGRQTSSGPGGSCHAARTLCIATPRGSAPREKDASALPL